MLEELVTLKKKRKAEKGLISAKRTKPSQVDRANRVEPSAFLIARKAESLGVELIVKGSSPRLGSRKVLIPGGERILRFTPSDAENPLSAMAAHELISRIEADAGEKFIRLRRFSFGVGVPAAPSFYRLMVASDPDEAAARQAREELTDDEVRELALERYNEYLRALSELRRHEGPAVRLLIDVADYRWPQHMGDVYRLRRGLRLLVRHWKLEG